LGSVFKLFNLRLRLEMSFDIRCFMILMTD